MKTFLTTKILEAAISDYEKALQLGDDDVAEFIYIKRMAQGLCFYFVNRGSISPYLKDAFFQSFKPSGSSMHWYPCYSKTWDAELSIAPRLKVLKTMLKKLKTIEG